MTNTKNTKRALLSSVLALFLCFAMLLGTTYAWFTDSVTSGSNIIQSGTLDVDLVDEQGNSMEGQIIEFVAADGRAQDLILWEPGCTYKTEPVYVVNNGTLDLKYEIIINGIAGNAKLLEAIEWTVTVGDVTTALEDLKGVLPAGEKTAAIVLTGHMKEEAGNEYQGLTAEGISIAVFATQYTAEEDSFNDQYDAGAEFAAQTMLKNVAAVAAGETATVKLESDGYVVINETNAIGAKVAGDVTLDLNGKTLFVKVEDGDAHMSLFNIVRGGKLTVTGNGTIEMLSGKNESKVTAIFNNTSGELVIENGTYKMDVKTYAQGSLIPTIIDNNGNAAGATTTINGGDFYHTRNMFRNFPSNNGITQLTINGGTFNGKADDWAAIWNQKASATTNEDQSLIEINGGEFNYVEIDNEFETGVTIADGVVVPIFASTAAELQAALDNATAGTTIYLAPGVNYGTLLLRPVDGNANTTTSLNEADGEGLTVYRNEYIRKVENLTIIGAPSATVDAIKVESGYIVGSGSSCNLVDVKGLVIDSVEFTDKADCAPHTYSAPIFFNLTWTDVDGLTVKNCKLIGNDDKVNFVYFTIDSSSAFDGVASNVTLTGNTVDGIARLCELRQTENVTITDNVIKNTVQHGMLLPVHNGVYAGNVTITGNTAYGIGDRFVRMAGAGDANVVIKDNTIINYEGEDADYIKVTDSNGTPVIENNVVGRSVYGLTLIPDGDNSKIIVSDKEGFLNLTKLFANWTELFTDGNGTTYTNYANGAGADYYYSGRWTVSLEADIDLNNATISPVVIKHPVSAGAPSFEGNNHTIKNAKIVTNATTENEAGLFNASSIAFKNLKLDNIHVTGSNVGNSTAGVLAGSCSFPVDNITITNSSVTGGKYTGGVVGYGYTDVLNCTLTNVTVKGGYKLGGLIGYICASGTNTGEVTGNTLVDCTVDGIGGGVYAGGKTEYVIGKLVGNYNCDGTCNNNTITNMTTSATDNIGKIEAGMTVTQ